MQIQRLLNFKDVVNLHFKVAFGMKYCFKILGNIEGFSCLIVNHTRESNIKESFARGILILSQYPFYGNVNCLLKRWVSTFRCQDKVAFCLN